MKNVKKLLGITIAAAVAAASFAGCTTTPTASSTPGASPTGTTAASAAPSAAAAQKLVVYSGSGPEVTGPIFDMWNKKYPNIKIEQVNAGTGELLSRIQAEKANPGGDVLWGGDVLLYRSSPDLFMAYESPEDKNMVLQDPNKKFHATVMMPQTIIVNTKLVKEADYPKTIKDLTDKKYQKVALADPNKSGTGVSIVNGVSSLYDWNFMTDLLKNSEVYPGSDPMFNAVRDGNNKVGFINEDLGFKWASDPSMNIKMIYPSDGVTYNLEASGIINGAKNADAAKKFIDFVCSKEVHEVMQDIVKRRSARTDVTPPQGMENLKNQKLIEVKFTSKDEILKNFDSSLDKARK